MLRSLSMFMMARFMVQTVVFVFFFLAADLCNADTLLQCRTAIPKTLTVKIFRRKCYHFISEERYWTGANDICTWYGGHLVTVGDIETNYFLTSVLNEIAWWHNDGVWIGLNDRKMEGRWKWTTENTSVNEALSWMNWAPGHPSSILHSKLDCVRMRRSRGRWMWVDTPCAMLFCKYRFICEYDALAPSSSVPSRSEAVLSSTSTLSELSPSGIHAAKMYLLETAQPVCEVATQNASLHTFHHSVVGSTSSKAIFYSHLTGLTDKGVTDVLHSSAVKSLNEDVETVGIYFAVFGAVAFTLCVTGTIIGLIAYNIFCLKRRKGRLRTRLDMASAERALPNTYVKLDELSHQNRPDDGLAGSEVWIHREPEEEIYFQVDSSHNMESEEQLYFTLEELHSATKAQTSQLISCQ